MKKMNLHSIKVNYFSQPNAIQLPISDLSHHPSSLLPIIQQLPTHLPLHKKLRWLALVAFSHPVLVPYVENSVEQLCKEKGIFSLEEENLINVLESLNILCQVKGFCVSVLNLREEPEFHGQYSRALWVNCLPTLSRGQNERECKQILNSVEENQVRRVKQFLNQTYIFKENVKMKLENIYEEHEEQSSIHIIDVELAKSGGLLTVNYLPSNYNQDYIQVWVDRTVQLNSLLGNFVCKERFGQFQYLKGPLTYAMEKGILLILNNFQQISNELLVGIRTLAEEKKISHNQKKFWARSGFRILGICSSDKHSKIKSLINKNIAHFELPAQSVISELPYVENEANRKYLTELLLEHEQKFGYRSSLKLWQRIKRARKLMVNSEENDAERLWNSFFTQSYVDAVNLQIEELTNRLSPSRTIPFEQSYKQMKIGRANISVQAESDHKIVKTQYSLSILQRIAICTELNETPLLVSETGCGKTTLVQYLAELGKHRLYVYNMSSGTDAMDLVGGFKPIDCRVLLKELFYTFVEKFRQIPESKSQKNEKFIRNITKLFEENQIKSLLGSLITSIQRILKMLDDSVVIEWQEMKKRLENIRANIDRIDSNLIFTFMEGNLIKAIKNGDWVLIDEINLATNDVLQKIVPLIEGKSLLLYEKGDLTHIERHPDFRIIGCMNPANDSGKKPLPSGLIDKFTILNLQEPILTDIEMMVKEITPQLHPSELSSIYFQVKKQKTVSLRNLSRCLSYINRNCKNYTWKRALYDGLVLGFHVKSLLKSYEDFTQPKKTPGFIELHGFLVEKGDYIEEGQPQIFHLTETFNEHLKDFLRAIAGTELPVLLEGPTSVGKTSIIRYVAAATNHKCIRINNHEHTEIEQYLGNYYPNKEGKLVFREGPLVQAVREGYWLILDELNLARTQILQCLNRLLDDNRELFIPEQQKHIKPHPHFRIFGTQNPASYSGRKTLSRAFRNRFVSLSFNDITIEDTMAIMKARRPLLSQSKQLQIYVKKTLEMLSDYRQRQRVFSKDGMITIRDLLKWTGRKFINKQLFMMDGFALLGERLRTEEEKKTVEKVLAVKTQNFQQLISNEYDRVCNSILNEETIAKSDMYVQMNKSFKRMAALTIKAVNNRQPVLLVGETGCGKTTLAQLLASISQKQFFSINCHKHTQASDLLGSLRPSTNPQSSSKFEYVNGVVIEAMLSGGLLLIDEINTAEDSVLQRLNQVLESNDIGVERGDGWQTIKAKQGFCIIATMNPSGDFGKKQLSPALRNRFTQIWVQPITHPLFIVDAEPDIKKMIQHKLAQDSDLNGEMLSKLIYNFVRKYNCEIAQKYSLSRKLLTMRDIGWICKFLKDAKLGSWQEKYYWGLRILAIEGINFIMNESESKLSAIKDELIKFINLQLCLNESFQASQLTIFDIIKDLSFPIIIKTDLPIQVLNIVPDDRIFFSPHTEMSDLLGQFKPHGSDFVWHDETLLQRIKSGGRLALIDLNLAQQPVIEGINSLFDHRGSIFVVQLNKTFKKVEDFRPVVVLQESEGGNRKGLPNSFLNRFVKVRVKNVGIKSRLEYLKKKYPQNDEKFWKLVQNLLQNQKEKTLSEIQLLCQLNQYNLQNRGLQIIRISPQKYGISSPPFNESEEKILKFLPLRHEFSIKGPELTKTFVNSYIIIKQTKYSICLVGRREERQSIANGIGYGIGKKVLKVILSTMTDMSDLLGSYEQVQQKMEEEESLLQKIFRKEEKKEGSSRTMFKYVKSQIMQTLEKQEYILYVEVPNRDMLQRLEKGIKGIYLQSVQIITGIDELSEKPYQSKFHFQYLHYHANQEQKPVNYQPNYTHMKSFDEEFRSLQTQAWINGHDEDSHERIVGWRRLHQFLSNCSSPIFERYEELWKGEEKRLGIQFEENPEQQNFYNDFCQKYFSFPHNRQEHMNSLSIYNLVANPDQNPFISLMGRDEEKIAFQIKQFQVLYTSDLNSFRKQADQLLTVLYRNGNTRLWQKFMTEVQRLHEELENNYLHQILVKFSDEEYKMVPILNNIYHIRLQFLSNRNLGKLANQIPSPVLLLTPQEANVMQFIDSMSLNIGDVSSWFSKMKVKDIQVYELLREHLKLKQTIFPPVSNLLMAARDLGFHGENLFELGLKIYQTFKPHSSMKMNLSYHIKTQLQVRTLQALLKGNENYQSVYTELCEDKYDGYRPQSFWAIQSQNQKWREEMSHAKKKYIYRGYDNVKILKDFYEKLAVYCSQIEKSSFDEKTIEQILLESYFHYYLQFKDILYPLYVGLLLIFNSKQNQSKNPQTMVLLEKFNQPFEKAIELILEKEEEEFYDRAKDYTKFQRKFKKTVIVDQYTKEGLSQNKLNDELEFQELFGKVQTQESLLDQFYLLMKKPQNLYSRFLKKYLFEHCQRYPQLVICNEISYPYTSSTDINIYEQSNMKIVKQLTKPITKILQQVNELLKKYNIDNIKLLATLCNKIQDHCLLDEVYKILIDCEFLTDKIFEVNSILPGVLRIDTQDLVHECLRLRKIELKNWQKMLEKKISRIEKSDTIEFVQFYRKFIQIGQAGQSISMQGKQCFAICDEFMVKAKFSCFDLRLYLLTLLSQNVEKPVLKMNINRIVGFYTYLKNQLNPEWERIRKAKIDEMKQYEKLAGWDSKEYLIFKGTCQKFQRKIHHILKTYEEELSTQLQQLRNNLRTKQICNSMNQFQNTISGVKEDSQNLYDEAVSEIFETLKDLQSEEHNTQSKMLLIKVGLGKLEEMFQKLQIGKKSYESKYIYEEMFEDENLYKKAVKYYYGMWDKLCQKTQTAWDEEIVRRVWAACEKIWIRINDLLPSENYEVQAQININVENLLILFQNYFFENTATAHSLLGQELEKVKDFLGEQKLVYSEKIRTKYPTVTNPEQIVSLMKLGYIVASIALNLEKKGLCIKPKEENPQEESGDDDIGEGMGIGQGEAHQGAKNIGDQIQFQEQVQGEKQEEKNKQKNAENEEENDINMEGNFEGDMYDKQKNSDQQGNSQQEEGDEEMGSVENQNREQDMKNQEGEAEGSEKADVDIEGQEEGSEELIDNQQPEQEKRKNQGGKDELSEEGEDEKSDWDDNNDQGSKINKQEEVELNSEDMENQDEKSEEGELQDQNYDQEKEDSKNQQMQDEKSEVEEEGNVEKDVLSEEINENEMDEERSEKEEKKIQKTRKTNLQAYGRTDLNDENPLQNEENAAEQKDQGGSEAQGGSEGNKGAGNPIHSLSAELLEEIMNLQRSSGKEKFMKDLNVVAHDSDNEEMSQEAGDQYQMGKADENIATNLAGMVQNQEREKQKQENGQRMRNQEEEKEEKKEKKAEQKKENEKKSNKGNTSKSQQKQKEKTQKITENTKQQERNYEKRNKNEEKSDKREKVEPKNEEQLRKIVSTFKINQEPIEIIGDQNQQISFGILEEASEISKILEEQLKSVLEPMDMAEYRGDYKTGKKLNLKKIIPFIASNYRKDRIWLRRTEPNERNYYIMLALDDTKSMHYGDVGNEALKGLLAISLALQSLSIKTCIASIKDNMNIVKGFQDLLNPQSTMKKFHFNHESSISHDLSIASFMESSIGEFERVGASQAGVQNKQLCFIISDGKMNKEYVRPYIRQAKKKDITYVFIIIDSLKESILEVKSVRFNEKGKVEMKSYLCDFPFQYFLVVKGVKELGEILASTLLQFIQQK